MLHLRKLKAYFQLAFHLAGKFELVLNFQTNSFFPPVYHFLFQKKENSFLVKLARLPSCCQKF